MCLFCVCFISYIYVVNGTHTVLRALYNKSKEFRKEKIMLYIIRSKTFENTGKTDTGL